MTRSLFLLLSFLLLSINQQTIAVADTPDWGKAKLTKTEYKPQKVVFDVFVNSAPKLAAVLDRASYLSKVTGADPFDSSIVLVLHGAEIPYFAIKNTEEHYKLMQRAESLVASDVIKIKMCRLSAQIRGFKPEDIHGFVEMVPMGDAEIIRLQNEEQHAYMR